MLEHDDKLLAADTPQGMLYVAQLRVAIVLTLAVVLHAGNDDVLFTASDGAVFVAQERPAQFFVYGTAPAQIGIFVEIVVTAVHRVVVVA